MMLKNIIVTISVSGKIYQKCVTDNSFCKKTLQNNHKHFDVACTTSATYQ